jgi:integrase
MTTWTATELRAFLDGVKDDRLYAAYLLLATSGMRREEALGLRWSDLDVVGSRAAIRQTVIAVHHVVEIGAPKTAKGRRSVSLDEVTFSALREHRTQQNTERLMMGSGWAGLDLIFSRVDGTPLHPERFSRQFCERVRSVPQSCA